MGCGCNKRGALAKLNAQFEDLTRNDRSMVLLGDDPYECLPGDALVVAPGIQQATRRRYDGDMVQITLRSRRVLTATPNHPVLTNRGWVSLGCVDVGDRLIDGEVGILDRLSLVQPNPERHPSPISEIFDSLAEFSEPHRVTSTAMDFHGDGSHSEIEVVSPDGLLGRDLNAASHEQGLEFGFSYTAHRERVFAVNSSRYHFPVWDDPPANCGVGSHSLVSPLVASHARRSDQLGLRPSPNGDIKLDQTSLECARVNAERTGERFQPITRQVKRRRRGHVDGGAATAFGFQDASAAQTLSDDRLADAMAGTDGNKGISSLVALDEIIDIQCDSVSCHVYNLHTKTHWYVSQGIIVHNCAAYSGIFQGTHFYIVGRGTEHEKVFLRSGARDAKIYAKEHGVKVGRLVNARSLCEERVVQLLGA